MTRDEIEFQCQLAYDAKFLELIGKNVGDKVKCSFFVHKGDRKHSYMSSIDGEGTIILDEKGYGVLSEKEYQDSKEVRDYPWSHSNFRTHWEYETKKIKVIYQIHKIMTREEAKNLLPIIKAFAEGKMIQDKIEGVTDWVDTDEINFEYEGQKIKHRIKPELKYRPFETKEECWNEMLKHKPFGWVIETVTNYYKNISTVLDYDIIFYGSTGFKTDFNLMVRDFRFIDGTPFGINKEE